MLSDGLVLGRGACGGGGAWRCIIWAAVSAPWPGAAGLGASAPSAAEADPAASASSSGAAASAASGSSAGARALAASGIIGWGGGPGRRGIICAGPGLSDDRRDHGRVFCWSGGGAAAGRARQGWRLRRQAVSLMTGVMRASGRLLERGRKDRAGRGLRLRNLALGSGDRGLRPCFGSRRGSTEPQPRAELATARLAVTWPGSSLGPAADSRPAEAERGFPASAAGPRRLRPGRQGVTLRLEALTLGPPSVAPGA